MKSLNLLISLLVIVTMYGQNALETKSIISTKNHENLFTNQVTSNKKSIELISIIEKLFDSKYNNSNDTFEWKPNFHESLSLSAEFGDKVFTKLDTIISYGKNNSFLTLKLDNYNLWDEKYDIFQKIDFLSNALYRGSSIITFEKNDGGDFIVNNNKYLLKYFNKIIISSVVHDASISCGIDSNSEVVIEEVFENIFLTYLNYRICYGLQGTSTDILYFGKFLANDLLNCNERDGDEGYYDFELIKNNKNKNISIIENYKVKEKSKKITKKITYKFNDFEFIPIY